MHCTNVTIGFGVFYLSLHFARSVSVLSPTSFVNVRAPREKKMRKRVQKITAFSFKLTVTLGTILLFLISFMHSQSERIYRMYVPSTYQTQARTCWQHCTIHSLVWNWYGLLVDTHNYYKYVLFSWYFIYCVCGFFCRVLFCFVIANGCELTGWQRELRRKKMQFFSHFSEQPAWSESIGFYGLKCGLFGEILKLVENGFKLGKPERKHVFWGTLLDAWPVRPSSVW